MKLSHLIVSVAFAAVGVQANAVNSLFTQNGRATTKKQQATK